MSELARAVQPPRSRGLLNWGLGLAAVVGTAVGVKMYAAREPAPPAVVPTVSPILLPIAAPQLVVVPAPAPPPAPEAEPPALPDPSSTVRALAPVIRAECVAETNFDNAPHCRWDDGFPAISPDGTTIATAYNSNDGGNGSPGLTVRIVDVATGKLVTTALVLAREEYVDASDPKRPALDKTIAQRAAKAQVLVDGYRAMTKLGTWDTDSNQGVDVGGLRAQFSDDSIRVIDTETKVAIWQRRFDVAKEFPNRKLDGEHCEPINANGMSTAWDAPTRTLLTTVDYLTGPEFCSAPVQRDYIVKVAP